MQLMNISTTPLDYKMDQFNDSIFLNVGPSLKRVNLRSILFVKGYGDYMRVQCEEKAYTVHITMKKLEDSLPKEDFFRVHRSYMIRTDKIERIFGSHLEINNTMIPISRNCKSDLLKLIPLVN